MNTNDYSSGMVLNVQTGENKSYDICLEDSFLKLEQYLKDAGCPGRRICIVTDSNVALLYLDEVKKIAGICSSAVCVYKFPAGEENKTLDTVRGLYETLIKAGFDRHDFLLALGGGVVGDLTGFAAATYVRGIKFIQVPTTLLSQIDSSIGGKTGVDFDSYKNMVGAFHQPSLVYINISTLKSLPEEQFASGMGELLKHGLILDEDYYEWTIDHMNDIEERKADVMLAMVARSCEIKKSVVEKDPNDMTGERALLNFGHTVGHAIEKLKNFSLMHGECVALGTVVAAYISWQRGMIDEYEFYEIRDISVGFGLPVSFEGPTAEEIVEATKKDKKMEAGRIRFVLLEKIGKAVLVSDVTDEEMTEAINFIRYS